MSPYWRLRGRALAGQIERVDLRRVHQAHRLRVDLPPPLDLRVARGLREARPPSRRAPRAAARSARGPRPCGSATSGGRRARLLQHEGPVLHAEEPGPEARPADAHERRQLGSADRRGARTSSRRATGARRWGWARSPCARSTARARGCPPCCSCCARRRACRRGRPAAAGARSASCPGRASLDGLERAARGAARLGVERVDVARPAVEPEEDARLRLRGRRRRVGGERTTRGEPARDERAEDGARAQRGAASRRSKRCACVVAPARSVVEDELARVEQRPEDVLVGAHARVLARRRRAVLEAARAGRAASSCRALAVLRPARAAGAGERGASGGPRRASATNAVPARDLVRRRAAARACARTAPRSSTRRRPARPSTSASALPGSTLAPVPTTLPLSSASACGDRPLVVARVGLLVDVEEEAVALLHPEADLSRGRACPVARTTASSVVAAHERVEQLVGPERRHAEALPELHLRIGLRGRVVERRRRQAVRLGADDDAHQVLHVVAARDEVGGERVEQLGRGGRVRRAQVVDGIDEAAAEEVAPHAVDEGAREPGVVRRRSPTARARRARRRPPPRSRAVEGRGLRLRRSASRSPILREARRGPVEVAHLDALDLRPWPCRGRAARGACATKAAAKRLEVLLLPLLGLVVVALRALDLHAEERARRGARHVLRVSAVLERPVDRAVDARRGAAAVAVVRRTRPSADRPRC